MGSPTFGFPKRNPVADVVLNPVADAVLNQRVTYTMEFRFTMVDNFEMRQA